MLRLKNRLPHSPWVGVLLVFTVSAFFFALTTAPPTFVDPDAFYHMTMSEIMLKERMVITDFQWLQFTTLKDAYVDHHLLYHVLLIPFIAGFGAPAGMKIATVLLGAAVIALVYALLRHWGVRHAWIWSMILLFSYDFVFRLSLGKANSFSMLIMLAGFYCLVEKKPRALGALSFLYVWSYGGFLQLPLMALILAVFGFFGYIIALNRLPRWQALKNIARLPAYSCIGAFAGLIIHPSFPKNIAFLWEQVVEIAIVNYQGTVSVGAEWYPLAPEDLFMGSMIITLLALAALFVSARHYKTLTPAAKLSGVMAILFLLLTLKSRRAIEYAIPWTILWTALSVHQSQLWSRATHRIAKRWKSSSSDTFSRVITASIGLYAVVGLCVLGASAGVKLYSAYERGIPFDRYAKIGDWLEHNAEPDTIVFHDDWDVFPLLFHQAPSMRYIVGLDATFMYRLDADLYRQWADVTTGKQQENLHSIIGDTFASSYVVVDHEHEKMKNAIARSDGFQLVYEDDDGVIFRVTK